MALPEPATLQIGKTIFIDARPELDDVSVRIMTERGTYSERVKKVDLWAAVFAIMDGKMQDDLMPVRQTQMMTFERIHMVRVKRDLKKGEVLKFKTKIDVPLMIVESLKGMLPAEGMPGLLPKPTIHTGAA